jgi:hypothetical protein
MHVEGGFLEKVHYSAVLEEEKNKKKPQRSREVSGAEPQRKNLIARREKQE